MFLSRKIDRLIATDRLCSGDVQAPSVDKETFITQAAMSCRNVILSTHDGTYQQIHEPK